MYEKIVINALKPLPKMFVRSLMNVLIRDIPFSFLFDFQQLLIFRTEVLHDFFVHTENDKSLVLRNNRYTCTSVQKGSVLIHIFSTICLLKSLIARATI